jgi:hypothetical protein
MFSDLICEDEVTCFPQLACLQASFVLADLARAQHVDQVTSIGIGLRLRCDFTARMT